MQKKYKQLQRLEPDQLRKLTMQLPGAQRTVRHWLGEHAFHNIYLWHSGLVDYEEPWVLITEDGDCLVTPGWTVTDLTSHGNTPEDLLPSPHSKLPLVS
jgi:hypothetical protein